MAEVEMDIRHVTIVGVGLLGGSAGLALKAFDPRIKIAGVGRRRESLEQALTIGAVDTVHMDAAEAVGQTDLVILATPVGAFEHHMRAVAERLRPGAIVTDVGSTKVSVVRAAHRLLGATRFCGSHPMAGSEQKGPNFARADLFHGATCILTPTAKTPPEVVQRVRTLWQKMDMRTVMMTPARHDRVIARVSHLPHALASLLMLLPEAADLDVSATGFRDTTRLASGDPEMWRDIFLTNRPGILRALDDFDESLRGLRSLVADSDGAGLEAFFASAKKRRDTTIARVIHDRRVAAE
jgi:prephenate dehydrogenase